MAELTNEFSWSKTRGGMFRTCLRQYYLHYYGSWGGWARTSTSSVRELYVMKNLKSRPIWVGEVVHDLTSRLVSAARSGQPIAIDEALKRLTNRMQHDWSVSVSGEYAERPNKLVGLREHYYGNLFDDKYLYEDLEHAKACVVSLYDFEVFQTLTKTSIRILEQEELKKLDVSGVKVWLKIDVATQSDAGHVTIIDWKTGQKTNPADTELQLAIYALYAARTWPVPVHKISAHEVNLRTGETISSVMDGGLIDWVRDYIYRSASAMKERLADPENNVARMNDHPMTYDYQQCRRCNFRRACDRENI